MQIPVRVRFDPPEVTVESPSEPLKKEKQVRRMKITEELLRKYYTDGYWGCRAKEAGIGEVRPHSEECRRRIMEAMEGDEEGRERKRRQ